MPFRTQIPTNLIGDEEVDRVDLMNPVRYRVEGIQYPIDEDIEVLDECRLFRSEKLIMKSSGKVTITDSGRIVIKR